MQELLEFADELDTLVSAFEGASYQGKVRNLAEAAARVESAWSGSNIGYQSCVYYANLNAPPPGAHFSSEWGLDDAVGMGTRGDWREYSRGDIKKLILERANMPDLTEAITDSKRLTRRCEDARAHIISVLTLAARDTPDAYVKSLLDRVNGIHPFDEQMFIRHMFPKSVQSRDALAMHQGLQAAPHQEILAIIGAIRSPADALRACLKR